METTTYKSPKTHRLLAAILLLLTVAACFNTQAATIYVDADASGADDGSTWADAYTDLHDALTAAVAFDEIWVAEGTYHPSLNVDVDGYNGVEPQELVFLLKSDVSLYGGFAGYETVRSQRDWDAHPTILSGDVDQNDDANPAMDEFDIQGVNSYYVLYNPDGSNVVVDGFVVTAAIYGNGVGAGLLQWVDGTGSHADVKIEHCRFVGSRTACRNYASNAGGADMMLVDCQVEYNGHGVHNLSHNYSEGVANVWIANSQFWHNNYSAVWNNGGGSNASAGSIAGGNISNCIFYGNERGVLNYAWYGNATMSIDNCLVMGTTLKGVSNESNGSDGVAILNLHNSIVWENGESIYNYGISSPPALLPPVSIGGAGGIAAQPTMGASVYKGSPPGLAEFYISNSIIDEPSCPLSDLPCICNEPAMLYNQDPLFTDPLNGDFTLQAGSPAINAGDNALLPPDAADLDGNGNTAEPLPLDLSGNDRVQDATVDMGPYESSNCTDADTDGICDAEDSCPFTFGEIGDPCDDGDPGTENDVYLADCSCQGTPVGGCALMLAVTNTYSGNSYTTVSLHVSGGTPNYGGIWNNTGYVRFSIISAAGGADVHILYYDGAEVDLLLYDANGCTVAYTAGGAVEEQPLHIEAYSVTASSPATPDGAIDITPAGGDGSYTFAWSSAGNANFGSTGEDLSGIPSGWYTVTVTDGAGETAVGTYWMPQDNGGPAGPGVYTRNKADMGGGDQGQRLHVYPNPFAEVATVEFATPVDIRVHLNVYDATGRLVKLLYNGMSRAGEVQRVSFTSNDLPNGVYHVEMTDMGGKSMYRRLLLAR